MSGCIGRTRIDASTKKHSRRDIPLETSIVRSILRYLNSLMYCRAMKRHGGRLRGGEADIYGSFHGYHFELEVKRPGIGILTDRQAACLNKWNNEGAISAVVTSIAEVRDVLRRHGSLDKKPRIGRK